MSKAEKTPAPVARPRYRVLDALRGLSMLLMIIHHAAIDLTMYGMVPAVLLDNPIVGVLQPIFGATFIALSGASGRFSRSNGRRGLKIALAAAAVTLSTWAATGFLASGGASLTVVFGILHFLAVASLIYPALAWLVDTSRLPGLCWLGLFVVARMIFPRVADVPLWLAPLGVMGYGFQSADYYPLLPWIFAYLFGIKLADWIKAGKMPEGFYTFRCPPLEALSRHSLWIYLIHQPVAMALIQLGLWLAG
jgi:uncharacterized membrane protein